ncbi:unnamed protein product [Candidula unifasciata]|uniref:Lengsin n=1 Tax=Candidula unifasciata TaxID=100452 RepID=A0A8S3ZR76_9EUPU|nr:unnamed protein product [Candidula unifasciata]
MAAISIDDFDFIQMVIHDVHGLPKGRMLAKRRMAGIIKDGHGIYGGICYRGILGELPTHSDFCDKISYGNKLLKPDLSTLRPCPKLGQGKYTVGQVLCRLEELDGSLDTTTPRTAAEIQIERLQNELGLTVRSAFEVEFNIRETKSKQYYGHVVNWAATNVIEGCQDLLFDMVHEMGKRGVHIDSLQTEYGPGQYEVTLDIEEGIQAADNTIELKNTLKTFMKSRGYDATFMTRIDPSLEGSNALHWNHSLWTASGLNAFLDNSKPNKLSELGCHWLAGLIEHAPAMRAFCVPTVNCYREIGQICAPLFANWSRDGRLASFRLKVEGENNVYIENRLPTSASNPYLVLACSLAAGIDGVKRKLALQALEADTVLTEAVGSKLVEYFINCKRTSELREFAAFGDVTDDELLKKEHEYYFENA